MSCEETAYTNPKCAPVTFAWVIYHDLEPEGISASFQNYVVPLQPAWAAKSSAADGRVQCNLAHKMWHYLLDVAELYFSIPGRAQGQAEPPGPLEGDADYGGRAETK